MQPWPLLRIVSQPGNERHSSDRANSRENETVAVQPAGVLGVELHELVEDNVGNGRHAPGMGVSKPWDRWGFAVGVDSHGSTGVSRVAGEGGINL
jgi:hypothetical protein